MQKKRIIGIITIIVGVIILILGMYARGRVANARRNAETGFSYFPDNSAKQEASGIVMRKIGSYDMPVLLTLIGGAIVTLAGIVITFRSHRR